MKKNLKQSLLIALGGSLILTFLVGMGALKRLDKWTQDRLYQRPGAVSSDIVIIGIDESAFERLGAYNTWDRHIMARALEALNADPANRPAVVAIDTLYGGETDKEADEHLASAAKALGNVITASVAVMGTDYVDDGKGGLKIENYAVLDYEDPYSSLKNVTTQGHINFMYDLDGIMRHGVLYVDNKGERIYSMAYRVAEAFLKANGEEITEPSVNKRGQFYVDYSAGPGGYDEGISIADLIEGKVPSDFYAGKIVFIGPYATALQDAYFTPVDPAEQMYGVELHANVAEQMISRSYKAEAPDFPQLLIFFVLCAVCGFIFQNIKVLWSSVTAIGTVAATMIVSVVLYNSGLLIHPLWIPFGTAVFYLVSIAMHYIRAALERRQITNTFARYVAPEIVKEILKTGTENIGLGGKTCDIAVLFVDVRGFTTMSERLSPEKVVTILNKYLTMASDAVEAHGGTLDKFVGDAMMAFWGAPLPQEDAVYNAILTAKDIVDGAAKVSEELKSEMGEELKVGVGVHFGPAVVGNMGAVKHMDYTAIGDTVNTAARLEANAPGGCVYISRAVADALKDRIEVESLGGTVKLKGKADGFEVLRLEKVW